MPRFLRLFLVLAAVVWSRCADSVRTILASCRVADAHSTLPPNKNNSMLWGFSTRQPREEEAAEETKEEEKAEASPCYSSPLVVDFQPDTSCHKLINPGFVSFQPTTTNPNPIQPRTPRRLA